MDQLLWQSGQLTLYTLLPTASHSRHLSPSQIYLSQTIQVGLISGALVGSYKGGVSRGLSFMAENAHRFPKTKGGFFAFQKARNNAMVKAGVQSAALTSLRFGSFMGVFALGEYCMEQLTRKESWINPIGGGLLTGLGVSGYCASLFFVHD